MPNPNARGPPSCRLSAAAFLIYSQLPSLIRVGALRKAWTVLTSPHSLRTCVQIPLVKWMRLFCLHCPVSVVVSISLGGGGWIGTECTVTEATIWPIVPVRVIYDERGAIGGMSDSGNRSIQKSLSSAALSTTTPMYLTWTPTRATAVEGRRLTAWAMARPR
jgi:hypothetical protein